MSTTTDWVPALGRLPSGLFILTARSGDQETGMLASWVQQCSFDPPQISVAMKRGRALSDWLVVGQRFVVNIIAEGQTQFLKHFGKGFAPGEPAFEGLSIAAGEHAPILLDALGYLEVEIRDRLPAGDHDLLISQVIGGKMQQEAKPFVHVRKNGLNY